MSRRAKKSVNVVAKRPWTRVPKLVVFDLDFTLWYPEMYELEGAPFRRNSKGVVTACDGEEVHLFEAVHPVLQEIALNLAFGDTQIAVASRTTYPDWARACMDLILVKFESLKEEERVRQRNRRLNETAETLTNLVDFQAIYPTNKRVHFKQLHEESGVPYEDMIFFDNEYGNIRDISAIGVTSIYCPDGLTMDVWLQGMNEFQSKQD